MKKRKTGGRKAGIPNKTTAEMRKILQSFLSRKFSELDNIFNELEPKDKVNAIIKMLPYLLPKQTETSFKNTSTPPEQDLSKLTDEELHKLIEITEKATIN